MLTWAMDMVFILTQSVYFMDDCFHWGKKFCIIHPVRLSSLVQLKEI